MKKLEVKILSAKSKKGFSLLSGINRPIKPGHVTKMAESLENMGCIRPVIVATMSFITGKPETYIIDGQHLFHGLMRLGWDIPYVEIDIIDKEDLVNKISLLNCSSRSWTIRDYILAWGSIHSDYLKLNHYENVYDIELSQIAELLMEGMVTPSNGGNNTMSRHIKKGTFEIDDEEKAVKLLDCITDTLKIIPRMDRVSNKLFISTYVNFMNTEGSYNHSIFLTNMRLHKDKFVLSTHDPEAFKKLFKTLIK